jgi:hypothetical protein
MIARFTSKCSFCQRKIVGGKHKIQNNDGCWLHKACCELKKDGGTATPEEDIGIGSCGVCYCCVRLQWECIDAHKE